MTKTTKPSAEHRALGILAGNWSTQGTIRASSEAAASEMRAIDRYQWLPGGFFMLHNVDALIGGEASQSIEVIGYDAEQGCYVSRSHGDRGASDGFTARLDKRAWEIDGAKVRFKGGLRPRRSGSGRDVGAAWRRESMDSMDGNRVAQGDLSLLTPEARLPQFLIRANRR